MVFEQSAPTEKTFGIRYKAKVGRPSLAARVPEAGAEARPTEKKGDPPGRPYLWVGGAHPTSHRPQ